MSRKVFVQIPANHPSGGIKVANQLVNLFREHAYESFVVLPHDVYQADWLVHPAPTINIERMKELCGSDDIVIDNWADKYTISQTMQLKARIKVFYSQGCTFYKTRDLIGDEHLRKDFGYTHFWAVSNDSLSYLSDKYRRVEKWYLVSPYFEFEIAKEMSGNVIKKNKILCLSRKGKSYIGLAGLLYHNRINFNVIDKFAEKDGYGLMLTHKFFLSTAIGVNKPHLRNILRLFKYWNTKHNLSVVSPGDGYKEGFPLPPAEAAMCGSIVIGFPMGGGLEWMSSSTCFPAKDRSYLSLMEKIREALSASDDELHTMRENAFRAVNKFNKEHTWQQIETFLSELEE